MGIKTLAGVAICAVAIGTSQSLIHIKVDEPRPVAAAVAEVEEQFGRVITYEDTRYVHPSEIDGVVMTGGPIELAHVARGVDAEAQIANVLAEILAQHTKAGNPGAFGVRARGGAYHVVPVAFKDASGAMQAMTPLLDRSITFAKTEETVYEMIERILTAASAGTGATLRPGMLPKMFVHRVTAEAHNEPARDVLWRVLQSIRPDLSWRFLCGVGESAFCALNIHIVPPAR